MKIAVINGDAEFLSHLLQIIREGLSETDITIISNSHNEITFYKHRSEKKVLVLCDELFQDELVKVIGSRSIFNHPLNSQIFRSLSKENRYLYERDRKKAILPHKKWTLNRPRQRY